MATSAVDANNTISTIPVGVKAATADLNSVMQNITGITNANNAWSQAMANDQKLWQQEQNQKAMEFNALEAAKNRDWQQFMSNTAHQREVADLKAAGLNPVLSAMNGNGAAVTSGATASGVTSSGAKGDTDTSGAAAMVSLLGQLLSQQTALANTAMSAQTQLAVADKYNAMSEVVAQISRSATLGAAATSAAASRYASDISRQNLLSQQQHDEYMTKNYPSGVTQAAAAIVGALTDSTLSGSISSAVDNVKSGLGLVKDVITGDASLRDLYAALPFTANSAEEAQARKDASMAKHKKLSSYRK